uniref:M-phase specific PLK1 interacting protein n=1 Tax=Cynoglossus semilaevis TaxID=244447 RepID=A0A3P8WBE9_CYNSE
FSLVMYRAPIRPQRSPGGPPTPGRFPPPSSSWSPGVPFPYRGSGNRGQSPVYSPRSNQRSWDGSPARFSGSRGFGVSPRYRWGGFRGPRSFSPGSSPKLKRGEYFPSMLKDPWAELQPVRPTDITRETAHHVTRNDLKTTPTTSCPGVSSTNSNF